MSISHPNVQLVINTKFTNDTLTLFQQRGRTPRARNPATHMLDVGVVLYILLTRRLDNRRTDGETSVDDSSVSGFNNSKISTPSRVRSNTLQENAKKNDNSGHAFTRVDVNCL